MPQKLEHTPYYQYSDYLRETYGEKVYKLPVNLPLTCPNRIHSSGCGFCAESGTGFEAMSSMLSVTQQLEDTKAHIQKKYKAKKFIAYFQNYTNTFLPLSDFEAYVKEAAEVPDIVEIDISTRPDCISPEYLEILKEIKEEQNINTTIELGLQTANYHTLNKWNRGHGLAEFIDAVLTIHPYGFPICTHIILNLPGDNLLDAQETARILSALHIKMVKLHSLYIAKNTILCDAYENGTIAVCSKEEYLNRAAQFLAYLDPEIVVERLFSRIPENDAVFSNWGTSWWKLKDELLARMEADQIRQGSCYHYLGGSALERVKNTP